MTTEPIGWPSMDPEKGGYANPRVVEGHVTSMEVENERLRKLIAKLRVRFIGVKTPHPAHANWRELWDEMVAAEAGGK